MRSKALICVAMVALGLVLGLSAETRRPDVTVAAAPPQASGRLVRKHALIVGINRDDLKYAETDATAFRDLIRDSLGFDSERTVLLSGARATRDEILTAIARIGRQVRTDVNNGDNPLVFVYYAGHSLPDDDGTVYLLTAGSRAAVPSTGLAASDFLAEIKNRIGADRIVYFLDTCYGAASANSGQARSPGSPYAILDAAWGKYFPRTEGLRMGFFSSSANQKSWEDTTLGRGIFTNYLLRALRGEGDVAPFGDGNGIVSAGEVKRYLDATVPSHATYLGHEQTPVPTLVFDPSLPLSAAQNDRRLGIYSEGIPEVALNTIRAEVAARNRLLSISFNTTGGYAVLSEKQFSAPEGIETLVKTYWSQYPQTPLRGIWLYGERSCLMIFGTNGYQRCGDDVPEGVLGRIGQLQALREPVVNVAFGPQNTAVVIGGGYSHTAGVPRDFADRLEASNKSKATIRAVALSPSGGWVIIESANIHSGGIPLEMTSTIWALGFRGKAIQALAFNPSTNGWIVVADP